MLAEAIETEVAEWIESDRDVTDAEGRRQVVRNGRMPERTIVTGAGRLKVSQPRVHDRTGAGPPTGRGMVQRLSSGATAFISSTANITPSG